MLDLFQIVSLSPLSFLFLCFRTDTSHVKSDEEALELASEIDDLNHETGVYLGILYFLVEICRADEEFGEELSEFDFFPLLLYFPLFCLFTHQLYDVESGKLTVCSIGMQMSVVAIDPPLPVYLLRTVAGLREKNTRGFPVKKVSSCVMCSFQHRPKRESQILIGHTMFML